MRRKKSILLAILTIMMVVISILVINKGSDIFFNDLSTLSKQSNLDDFRLTIYYMSPYTFTLRPLSADDLIKMSDEKITIEGKNLKEHMHLLNLISKVDLVPVNKRTYVNARIYFTIENKQNRKVLEVLMWGDKENIIVNGTEIEENHIFYDFLIPFLSKDSAKELKTFINRGK